MKLLEAEEEDLLEGKGEVTGDLCEGEGGRIAAEEEIQDELLAGGEAGDERTAVARESGGNGVVRGLGVSGKRLERRSSSGDGSHGRGRGKRCDEVEHQLSRLARFARREEVAHLLVMILRTRRNLVAACDQLVHYRSDSYHRFLHRQLSVSFLVRGTIRPAILYYVGKWQVSACFQPGERTNFKKAQQMPR